MGMLKTIMQDWISLESGKVRKTRFCALSYISYRSGSTEKGQWYM